MGQTTRDPFLALGQITRERFLAHENTHARTHARTQSPMNTHTHTHAPMHAQGANKHPYKTSLSFCPSISSRNFPVFVYTLITSDSDAPREIHRSLQRPTMSKFTARLLHLTTACARRNFAPLSDRFRRRGRVSSGVCFHYGEIITLFRRCSAGRLLYRRVRAGPVGTPVSENVLLALTPMRIFIVDDYILCATSPSRSIDLVIFDCSKSMDLAWVRV